MIGWEPPIFDQCELPSLSRDEIEQRARNERKRQVDGYRGGPCMCDYYGCAPCLLHRFDDYIAYLYEKKREEKIELRYYRHRSQVPNEKKDRTTRNSRAEAKLDELRWRGII